MGDETKNKTKKKLKKCARSETMGLTKHNSFKTQNYLGFTCEGKPTVMRFTSRRIIKVGPTYSRHRLSYLDDVEKMEKWKKYSVKEKKTIEKKKQKQSEKGEKKKTEATTFIP